VIRYPDDQATEAEAIRHGIPDFVLIRDLVRIVEVLNLAKQDFFGTESVLAGSMALRCFNTPRFTVYDADFATTVEAKRSRGEMRDMLRYLDEDLEIAPAELTPHDTGGTAWKAEPITYLPPSPTWRRTTRERSKPISRIEGWCCRGRSTNCISHMTSGSGMSHRSCGSWIHTRSRPRRSWGGS
jgi:hypothetical protein